MLNYIICDDVTRDREKIIEMIDNYMMKNDIEYDKHIFSDYNEAFMKLINKKLPGKIYILDIDVPSHSGIDIARIIRNRDYNCILIFLTGEEKFHDIVSKEDFLYFSFINKFNDCENRLSIALDKGRKLLGSKQKVKIKENGCTYNINYDDILYITRDSAERKTILQTDYNDFKLNMPLNEIKKLMTGDFVQTHRACIVNTTRIVKYCKHEKMIWFDNGKEINLVSSKFNGELI